jgi:hypothetical protein
MRYYRDLERRSGQPSSDYQEEDGCLGRGYDGGHHDVSQRERTERKKILSLACDGSLDVVLSFYLHLEENLSALVYAA